MPWPKLPFSEPSKDMTDPRRSMSIDLTAVPFMRREWVVGTKNQKGPAGSGKDGYALLCLFLRRELA